MTEKKETEKQKKGEGCYLIAAVMALFVVGLVKIFWPDFIPFTFFEFWYFKGSLAEVFRAAWPVFAWGIVVNIIVAVKDIKDRELVKNAEAFLTLGGCISIFAGVFEELSFRWILFYSAIIGAKVSNFLFFGWAGFGIGEWVYTNIAGPVANFFSLGALEPWLFGTLGWAVGAAIIGANGNFRKGHEYQGWFGSINSWFIGMFFFYIMFNYGLLAAVLVHFLYDMFIFVVHYFDAVVERRMLETA